MYFTLHIYECSLCEYVYAMRMSGVGGFQKGEVDSLALDLQVIVKTPGGY